MKVDDLILLLEDHRGKDIFYQDAEGAFFPMGPILIPATEYYSVGYENALLIEGLPE